MSKHINDKLPTELLIKVIQNLEDKSSIKTCLSVCKFWRMAAQEVYKLNIVVDEDSLETLSEDIKFFATRVKGITLTESDDSDVDTRSIWCNLISSCTNLTYLSIQTMYAHAYIWPSINTTIKTPEHFRSLCANDFICFLEAFPHLKEVHVRSFYEIRSDSKIPSANLCLDHFGLVVERIDVNSLIFITACLKKIKSLSIVVEAQIILEDFSAEELLTYLKDFTSSIPKFFIYYVFKNERFILKNNQEPTI